MTGPPFAKHPISRSAKGGGHLARGLKSGRSISNGIGSHQRPHCRTRRPSCTRLHVGTLDLERDWSIMTSTLKDAHRIAASLQVRTHKLERHWLGPSPGPARSSLQVWTPKIARHWSRPSRKTLVRVLKLGRTSSNAIGWIHPLPRRIESSSVDVKDRTPLVAEEKSCTNHFLKEFLFVQRRRKR